MSYSGADASLHRHSIPNQLERYLNTDFELGALEQKALAGVVKGEDTIDVALYLGQTYGRTPTNSSRPTLEFPIWSLRTSAPEFQPPPEIWGPAYERLIDVLPEEIKKKLLEELAKPFIERSPEWIAFNGLLETAAKILVTIELVSHDIDPLSTEAAKRQEYLTLPETSLTELETIALEILEQAPVLLQEENSP